MRFSKLKVALALLAFIAIAWVAVVALVDRSPGRTFERDLVRAVKRRNSKGVVAAESKIMDPKSACFVFPDETARKALYRAHARILREWLLDRTSWSAGIVSRIVDMSGGHTLFGRSGFINTEEGFKLISAVLAEQNKESGDPNRKLVIWKNADGTASLGISFVSE